jgi:hypothetical protein
LGDALIRYRDGKEDSRGASSVGESSGHEE